MVEISKALHSMNKNNNNKCEPQNQPNHLNRMMEMKIERQNKWHNGTVAKFTKTVLTCV